MKKRFKFLILLSSLLSGIFCINNTILPVFAIDSIPEIDISDPLEDLLSEESFRTRYLNDEFKSNSGSFQFLSFVEYKYDTSFTDDFGLYIYVYNPNNDITFDYTSIKNKIEFGIKDKTNTNLKREYLKYDISFISKSGGIDYIDKFLKYKVNCDYSSLYSCLDKENRIYDVVGLELKQSNKSNATDYDVSSYYNYSGYCKGCNNQSESTLTCHSDELETLRLNCHPTSRRSGALDERFTEYKSLNSVYFTIPNEYLNKYGDLWSLKFEYYKYLSNCCFALLNELPTDDFTSGILTHRYLYSASMGSFPYYQSEFKGDLYAFCDPTGHRVFKVEKANDPVNYEEFKNECKYYTSYMSSTTRKNAYSGPIVVDKKMLHDNIEAYDFKESFIDTLGHTTLLYGLPIFDFPKEYHGESWSDVKYFEEVSSVESDGSKYFINQNDVTDFNNMFTNKGNSTMFILRFDMGNYYSAWFNYHKHAWTVACNDSSAIHTIGYRFYEDFYLDFDIIDVGFKKESKITIIPVVCDPVDVILQPTPPDTPTIVSSPDWLKIILMVIALLILVILLIKFIKFILNFKNQKLENKANKQIIKEHKAKQKREKKARKRKD